MDLSKANIPVVDISPSNPDAPEQLLSAASKYGFVFVENSPQTGGIPPQDIAKMFELSKEFFAAPVEVKEQVSIASNKAGKNHGWLSQGIEKLDPKTQKRADVKEYVRPMSLGHISASMRVLSRNRTDSHHLPQSLQHGRTPPQQHPRAATSHAPRTTPTNHSDLPKPLPRLVPANTYAPGHGSSNATRLVHVATRPLPRSLGNGFPHALLPSSDNTRHRRS